MGFYFMITKLMLTLLSVGNITVLGFGDSNCNVPNAEL